MCEINAKNLLTVPTTSQSIYKPSDGCMRDADELYPAERRRRRQQQQQQQLQQQQLQ
jgi:hypothetical protein